MNGPIQELAGLHVSVDDVIYMPSLDAPDDRPFPFVYFITIRNNAPMAVTIRFRKWVVRQQNGETIVVEGDGVVGQFPNLAPGQSFSYDSYHVIKSESTATGSFFGSTDDGRPICVRIPPFEMQPPLFA